MMNFSLKEEKEKGNLKSQYAHNQFLPHFVSRRSNSLTLTHVSAGSTLCRMATIVSTLIELPAAQDYRTTTGAKEFNASSTRQQDAMMSPATSNLDAIKSPAHVYLHNDGIYDVDDDLSRRNDIRKGIPSLPAIWTKRVSAQKERRKVPKAKLKPTSDLQPVIAPPPLANGSVPELSPQQPRRYELCATEMKVQVPLQIRDRLKTWNLSSTLNLTADENATFEPADFERLKQFVHFLDENCPALFHGRLARNLCLTLVAISSAPATGPPASPPYICIKGLMKESEITSVHTILSQRSVRAHYKPLRLCYDKSLVETAASEATYHTNTSETPETLCGTLLRTEQRGKGIWTSTIGGIIEIDGKFFAVTSSHHPSTADSTSEEGILDSISGTPGSSLADTLFEKGSIEDDIEPALIVDTWKGQEHQSSLKASPTQPVLLTKPPHPTNPFFWPDFTPTRAIEGSDWCLLDVEERLQLPNSIPLQRSGENSSQREQRSIPAHSRRYLEAYPIDLSKRPVYILSGVSGICLGLLSTNVSFLSIRGERSRVVWSVKLDTGFGK
jgi:hypothetical protein